MQLLSGIWLAMFYTPTPEGAFASVEYIMRDVKFGWLIRYLHSTGASAFFIVVYLHMLRGLMYGSFKKPRELVWLVGMFIYLVLLAEAFMGYLLPWGQMSFWGAQVITSLFSAIPVIGNDLGMWVRGDFNVSGATLNRFYALHIVGMPLLLLGLVWMHITALHQVGSNNPDGVEIKKYKDDKGHPIDGIPFHPYYTVKDNFGISVFLMVFVFVAFFIPDMGGYFLEHANFSPADPMKTPDYIAPVWYMTPFYAVLRAIPDKLFGVTAMVAAIVVLFFIPWLDRSPVKSIRYRGWKFKLALGLFVVSFVALGYLGTVHVTPVTTLLARIFSVVYFMFFILMPIYTKLDKTKPVPERVTK
jgi:ubiquinol-cytochrome c reductase cytochrome b subunit